MSESWQPHLHDKTASIVDLTVGGTVRPYARNRVDDLLVRAHWLQFELRVSSGALEYYYDSKDWVD